MIPVPSVFSFGWHGTTAPNFFLSYPAAPKMSIPLRAPGRGAQIRRTLAFSSIIYFGLSLAWVAAGKLNSFEHVLAVIAMAAFEEIIFRKLLLSWLKRRIGVAKAVCISSLVFAAVHLDIIGFPSRLLGGVLLALLYVHVRKIWIPILVHASHNNINLPLTSAAEMTDFDDPSMPEIVVRGVVILIEMAATIYLAVALKKKQAPASRPAGTQT